MLLGVIADDFTGASDIANTLAKDRAGEPGLSTTLFLGLPLKEAPAGCEAGVIALKTRSIPADEAVATSLAALAWLRAQGCRQIVFKYCSTFDSTPPGNIGPVGEALAEALGAKGVVVCPAFPGAGRTVYQGNLFVGDVPLNESSLRDHPLNPMTDSDLRRWLKRQARAPVGAVGWPVVHKGAAAIRSALAEVAERDQTLVVVDAIADEDLLAIGHAVAGMPLITGGSGIALGLGRNFSSDRQASGKRAAFEGIAGPEAILAGSCSQATLSQIEYHAGRHPVLAIDVEAVMLGETTPQAVAGFLLDHGGEAPLAYSSGSQNRVKALQDKHGRAAIAERLDHFFADIACELTGRGLRRLVVAGGETSGAVVSALGLDALTIGPEIAPGVPVVVSDKALALALKSGNFGQVDFFERALDLMETKGTRP